MRECVFFVASNSFTLVTERCDINRDQLLIADMYPLKAGRGANPASAVGGVLAEDCGSRRENGCMLGASRRGRRARYGTQLLIKSRLNDVLSGLGGKVAIWSTHRRLSIKTRE